MNLEAIAERLEQLGVGQRGESIFVDHIPTKARGILLREFDTTDIDHYLPNYRKSPFQVISRDSSRVAAKQKIDQAISALIISQETALTGILVKQMLPRHEPFSYPTSAGNNIEFVVNMDAWYVIVP